MEAVFEILPSSHAEYDAERASDWWQFVVDMRLEKICGPLRGGYPETVDDGEGDESFAFVFPYNEPQKLEAAFEAWERLCRSMKLPSFTRWLTFGSMARRIKGAKNDEYKVAKLFMAFMAEPHDAISALLLKKKHIYATTEEMRRHVEDVFAAAVRSLRQEKRMEKHMNFVTLGSSSFGPSQRRLFRIAAIHACMAAACMFFWRVCGVRDKQAQFLERFARAVKHELEAELLSAWFDEGVQQNERPNASLDEICLQQWRKQVGRICQDARDRAPEDRILAQVEISQAGASVLRQVAAGVRGSSLHQGDCEVKIARLKSRQQEHRSAHRGIMKIDALEIKMCVVLGEQSAKECEELGGDSEEESEPDDGIGEGQGVFEALNKRKSRPKMKKALTKSYCGEDLAVRKRPANYYNLHMRGRKIKFGEEVRDEIDANEETTLREEAYELSQKMLLLQIAHAKRVKELAEAKRIHRIHRQKRAQPQIEFYASLKRRAIQRLRGNKGRARGTGNATGEAGYSIEKVLDTIRTLLEVSDPDLGKKLIVDQVLTLWKQPPAGLERVVAWLAGARCGKTKYWEHVSDAFFALGDEVRLSEDAEKAELAEANPETQAFWENNADCFIAVEFKSWKPEVVICAETGQTWESVSAVPAENFPEVAVVYFAQRNPQHFLGSAGALLYEGENGALGGRSDETTSLPVLDKFAEGGKKEKEERFNVFGTGKKKPTSIREKLAKLEKQEEDEKNKQRPKNRLFRTRTWQPVAPRACSTEATKKKTKGKGAGAKQTKKQQQEELEPLSNEFFEDPELSVEDPPGASRERILPAEQSQGGAKRRSESAPAAERPLKQQKSEEDGVGVSVPPDSSASRDEEAAEAQQPETGDGEAHHDDENEGEDEQGHGMYDDRANEERREAIREEDREKLKGLRVGFGVGNIPGFEVHVVDLTKVMARAVREEYVETIELWLSANGMAYLLGMRGRTASRTFTFDAAVADTKAARALGLLWCARTWLLWRYYHGKLKGHFEDRLKPAQEWMMTKLQPYINAAQDATQDGAGLATVQRNAYQMLKTMPVPLLARLATNNFVDCLKAPAYGSGKTEYDMDEVNELLQTKK
eukprot:g15257.t1